MSGAPEMDRILGDAVRHALRLLSHGGSTMLVREVLLDAALRAEEVDRG